MPKKSTDTTKKPAPRKLTYEELELAAGALGARVIWALKFLKVRGSGMVMNSKSELQPDGSVRHAGVQFQNWEDYFMDALDMIGHRIDRKAFYEKKPSRKATSSRKTA